MTNEEAINIPIVKVQTQMGTSDCGLFSLAFATSLCAGVNPTEECSIPKVTFVFIYLSVLKTGKLPHFQLK